MRAVIQRVTRAAVRVGDEVVGAIDHGLLVLLGVAPDDGDEDVRWLAEKVARLRIFADDEGRFARSVVDIGGRCLVVSQFTLFASTRKGTRPGFSAAAPPEVAIPHYEAFCAALAASTGAPVATGRFGAAMAVESVNDGPVTLVVDTANRE